MNRKLIGGVQEKSLVFLHCFTHPNKSTAFVHINGMKMVAEVKDCNTSLTAGMGIAVQCKMRIVTNLSNTCIFYYYYFFCSVGA